MFSLVLIHCTICCRIWHVFLQIIISPQPFEVFLSSAIFIVPSILITSATLLTVPVAIGFISGHWLKIVKAASTDDRGLCRPLAASFYFSTESFSSPWIPSLNPLEIYSRMSSSFFENFVHKENVENLSDARVKARTLCYSIPSLLGRETLP